MTIADELRLIYVHSGGEFAFQHVVNRAVHVDGYVWTFEDGSRLVFDEFTWRTLPELPRE